MQMSVIFTWANWIIYIPTATRTHDFLYSFFIMQRVVIAEEDGGENVHTHKKYVPRQRAADKKWNQFLTCVHNVWQHGFRTWENLDTVYGRFTFASRALTFCIDLSSALIRLRSARTACSIVDRHAHTHATYAKTVLNATHSFCYDVVSARQTFVAHWYVGASTPIFALQSTFFMWRYANIRE